MTEYVSNSITKNVIAESNIYVVELVETIKFKIVYKRKKLTDDFKLKEKKKCETHVVYIIRPKCKHIPISCSTNKEFILDKFEKLQNF